ncbi:GNAT family N-acetyltransferase [Parafrankia elaeagni]|uniref:GNAT family N-acetyltransferase n=1 Tax=Parafrankia elaeagni TaxID=222534 RepID=UPI00037B33EC|nr:GNAT family N-acetyltransferase [Parafrankia elaeagni]
MVSNSQPTILVLSQDDWKLLREVRLKALREAPHAFASSLELETAFAEADWRHQIQRSTWFLARSETVDVGVVAGTEQGPRERHLSGLWVAPNWRGKGISRMLFDAVEAWARKEGTPLISLWVSLDNLKARAIYQHLGFTPTGLVAPFPGDAQRKEERMVRRVPSA